MRRLVTALLIALALAQCAMVDIFAPRLAPSLVAQAVVALNNGVMARMLAEPVVGRTWGVMALIAVVVISVRLPAGWGLSAAMLSPMAWALLTNNFSKE